MCHDCKASRRRTEPKVFDHEGKRAEAAQEKLNRIRKSELPRLKQRLRMEGRLRGQGLQAHSVGREQHGGMAQRVVVGHKSRFHDPAVNIANAIERALDPNQLPPRRFVPKKREPHELKRVFREDGKVNSHRYHGWDVNEVAEVNPKFLAFLGNLPVATVEDKKKIRTAMLKAALKRRAAQQGGTV